jgi:hypothetical protein
LLLMVLELFPSVLVQREAVCRAVERTVQGLAAMLRLRLVSEVAFR